MNRAPLLPRRRSPALNALVLGGIILALVIGGVIVWNSWSQGSRTAVDEAHEAVVQPVEPPIASTVPKQDTANPAR